MEELKTKTMGIDSILDKISKLQINDKDKATILEEIKKNIMNPSAGENKNLNEIQQKYTQMNMPQGHQNNQYHQHTQYNPYGQGQTQQYQNYQPMNIEGMNQSQPMTTAHFEILKSKLDSLQFELIDLLRHVKDYTQRYMNAIRQQDLDKINEYITNLFQVDKTLKETQALSEAALPPDDDEDTEASGGPADRQSVITKATSGIKNFFGGIGNNVAGITDLVSSTANMANSYLTKKILPTSNASVTSNVSVNSTNTTKPIPNNVPISKNNKVMSVDDYISNMNKIESMNNSSVATINSTNSNIVSSNSNNINKLGNLGLETSESSEPSESGESNEIPESNEGNEGNESSNTESEKPKSEEDLEGALKQLNDEMNKDIEKTVNSNTGNTSKEVTQTGGKRRSKIKNKKHNGNHGNHVNHVNHTKEHKLTHKIKLLKLKLTHKNLQKQLKKNKSVKETRKR